MKLSAWSPYLTRFLLRCANALGENAFVGSVCPSHASLMNKSFNAVCWSSLSWGLHDFATLPQLHYSLIRFYGPTSHSLQLPWRRQGQAQGQCQWRSTPTIKPTAIKYPFRHQRTISSSSCTTGHVCRLVRPSLRLNLCESSVPITSVWSRTTVGISNRITATG